MLTDFTANGSNILLQILRNELTLVKTIFDLSEKKVIFSALTDLIFKNTASLNQTAFACVLNSIVENLGIRRYRPAKYAEFRENLLSKVAQDSKS